MKFGRHSAGRVGLALVQDSIAWSPGREGEPSFMIFRHDEDQARLRLLLDHLPADYLQVQLGARERDAGPDPDATRPRL